MSRVEKIIALVLQYEGEGEDKLGYVDDVDMDFKHQVSFDYDRFAKDIDTQKPKEKEDVYYQVSVRFQKEKGRYKVSARVQTGKCSTIELVYLQLQELLKLEVRKKQIMRKLSDGHIGEDTIKDKPKSLDDLYRDLSRAINKENYEKARLIQSEIDQIEKERG